MQIVVNAAFLKGIYHAAYLRFTSSLFTLLVQQHPDHHFIFLCEKGEEGWFPAAANTAMVIIHPRFGNPILWKYWNHVRIPAILKKYKADFFFSSNFLKGTKSPVAQVFLIPDLACISFPAYFRKTERFFYTKYLDRNIRHADRILTLSQLSKTALLKKYQLPADRITAVTLSGELQFNPVTEDTRQLTRERYSGGKNYFLYQGPSDPSKNLIRLLKAFSFFKKRLHSGMKLLLCLQEDGFLKSFNETLRTYKYRADVIVLTAAVKEDLVSIAAAAYAMIHPGFFDGFPFTVVAALQTGVPVITSGGSVMQEIAGDAGLYADPADPRQMGEQMMLIYKDENKRNELIQQALLRARQYQPQKGADQLWNLLRPPV